VMWPFSSIKSGGWGIGDQQEKTANSLLL
jgi:hypothetical protein